MSGKKSEAKVFAVRVNEEIHSILKTPASLPPGVFATSNEEPTLNLVMADVSASMSGFWDSIMDSWNKSLAPLLKDTTKIFVFGRHVYFRRKETFLEQDDFLSESTNLTEAIEKINGEVQSSKETFINLFLITDGHHNATGITPDIEIAKLSIPKGKVVEVYLLGLGYGFPVEYSLTIRSSLHNGNSNVPSLFWAKCEDYEEIREDISQQIESIADIIKKGAAKVQIAPPGHLVPGFPIKESFYLGEFVYFPTNPKNINLVISTEDGQTLDLDVKIEEVELKFLLDRVFRQWNSIIIQTHRKKEKIPTVSFTTMESIYTYLYSTMEENLNRKFKNQNSIKYRLLKKNIKFLETEFRTLMNQSKKLIGLEGKYMTEIELAETILKTTVKSKYDMKNLKMKGQSLDEYNKDMEEFKNIYNSIKESVLAFPEPSSDDCCRVTMGSLIKDLQDPSFQELLSEDKFTFLKTITVTGLPIYAPVKDSSQINPWSMCIKNILNSPFTLLSQCVLELSADVGNISANENKEVYLQEGDESTLFNAIVPVFRPEVIKLLKPLLTTNIFAMLCTFCILKNAHIIDHFAHIAALGCIWIEQISQYSKESRPEFLAEQLNMIEATARIYIKRKSLAKYLEVLLSDSPQALMTESTQTFEKRTLKCETLIKPMFLLYLNRGREEVRKALEKISVYLLVEFIGRSLSNFQNEPGRENIYSQLFVPELATKGGREKWLALKQEKIIQDILKSFREENGRLLAAFYKLEDLNFAGKEICRRRFKTLQSSMFQICVNRKLINNIRNTGSAGNILLSSFRAFFKEMELDDQFINDILDDKKLLVYVYHSVKHKSSRERMSSVSIATYEETLSQIEKAVSAENSKLLKRNIREKVIQEIEKEWLEDYHSVHRYEVIEPLTKAEILQEAVNKDVQVTESNFEKTFKFSRTSKLLRNACMTKQCPFYLIPNRNFNQHLSVERLDQKQIYAHQLHKISKEVACTDGDANEVISNILENGYKSQNGLKIPPTPHKEYLNNFKDQISNLVLKYKYF